MYTLRLSDRAKEDIAKLKRNDPNSFKKISKLLIELTCHPREGTGQVELLKDFDNETYSRRISQSTDLFIAFMMMLLRCLFFRPTVTMMTNSLKS